MTDGLTSRQRGFAIAGLMAGMFLAGLDALVVGTAMPTIVAEIGGIGLYPWAFTAYMLTAAVMMPVFGKIADVIGRRVAFTGGILAFVAGSVLAAVAGNMPVFIAARTIQGIGAGAMFTLPFAFLGVLYPPAKRARAVGFLAAVWAVSAILGPVLGALVLEIATWPWVFWINVPVGAVALVLVNANLPDAARAETRSRVDAAGLVLLALATSAFLVGLDRGILLLAVAAVPLFFALHRVETRAKDPLVPVHLLGDPGLVAALAAGFLAHFAVFGAIAFAPLAVQQLEGSVRAAGLTLLPLSIMWSSTSFVGGRLVHRVGERRFILAGMLTLVVALGLAFVLLPKGMPWAGLVMGLLGFSMGLQTPSLLTSVQNRVATEAMGQATSLLQFVRQLGSTAGIAAWGLAILGTVSAEPGVDAAVLNLPPGVMVGLAAALLGVGVATRLPAHTLDKTPTPAPGALTAGGRD